MMDILNTGIDGLDEMLHGGIPKKHIVAVIGSPGTGKSTLALQFIYAGLRRNERCVYISLEEDEEDIIKTAEMFGWELKPYIENKKLALIRLSAQNIKVVIDRMEKDLPKLFKSFNTTRLAVDPITLYEMLFDKETERRDHVFNFANMIKKLGITAILTSEIHMGNPYYSKYGLIEYVTDGVILLRQVRDNCMKSITTAIEILKMRRVDHSREIKPYSITSEGIVVHSESEVFI